MSKRKTESIPEFFRQKLITPERDLATAAGSFNVFSIEDRIVIRTGTPAFVRRDFYKIMLFQGTNVFHYPDKSIPVKGNTLLFFNPNVPYSYDALATDTKGYFCLFQEEFLQDFLRIRLDHHPLFAPGSRPVFSIGKRETGEAKALFLAMLSEQKSGFGFKYDLIRTYLLQLIFQTMKRNPSNDLYQDSDAGQRLMRQFKDLIEREFPIESTAQRFGLRSPKVCADRLAVHVNYLNRAIKKISGKTTSDHIFDRLIGEARSLLKHSSWTVSEIGYALGFETPAQFNHFFRLHAGTTPLKYRMS